MESKKQQGDSKRRQGNFKKNHSSGEVRLGTRIKVRNMASRELVEFQMADRKNPFYGKRLNDTVKVKGEEYRIIGVDNRRGGAFPA